jgi:SnoaL-like domain
MSETSVDVLAAKQAITEVLYHYCRGLDRMDRAMALSVWHPDGTADYGEIYLGTGHGFVDWVWPVHAAMATHSHQITNVLIEVGRDGDSAVSEAYVTAAVRTNPQDGQTTDFVARGRYLDRWSRRSGTWAIDHRQYVDDLTEVHRFPVAEVGDGSASVGGRDRDDPSYALFGR